MLSETSGKFLKYYGLTMLGVASFCVHLCQSSKISRLQDQNEKLKTSQLPASLQKDDIANNFADAAQDAVKKAGSHVELDTLKDVRGNLYPTIVLFKDST